MLTVTNMTGITERLTGFSDFSDKEVVNGERSIKFKLTQLPENEHSYPLVKEESIITFEGEKYVIFDIAPDVKTKSVKISAKHIFFEIGDDFVEDKMMDGFYTINDVVAHALSQTPDWGYSVSGTFGSAYWQGFGNDNPISLLDSIMDKYGAERTFSSETMTVYIHERIGVDTDDQVRAGHNMSTMSYKVNTQNIKTAIKVYYKPDKAGEYESNTTYISPNASNYRRTKWAKPLYLDEVTTEADALRMAQHELKDQPEVSITVDLLQLQQNGYSGTPTLGNGFYIKDDRINLFDRFRIMELERYPFDPSKLTKITTNNKRRAADVTIYQLQMQDSLDKSAVKQKKIYNGVTISAEEGVKVERSDGVVTVWMNATEGIRITNLGIQRFYVDEYGNVTMDGRLLITHLGNVVMEAFMDEFGGRLWMGDREGKLQLLMGSEEHDDGEYKGGVFKLFSDRDSTQAKVELGVGDVLDGGRIVLREENNTEIEIEAGGVGGTRLILKDETGTDYKYADVNLDSISIEEGSSKVEMTPYGVYHNGQLLATRSWVSGQIPSVDGKADSYTYGLGLAWSEAANRLYVRIHGQDVGHINLDTV